MTIQQENNSQRGSFFIEEDGKRVAELAYTWRDKAIISLDHTEVDEVLEGKGIGKALMEHATAYARDNGIKYILYCTFAKSFFKRHKEYSDVLVSEQ